MLSALTTFILVTLIQFAGSSLQGAVGYGMVLVTGPLLALINPGYLPGPSLWASVLLSLLLAWREKMQLDFWGLKWVLGGRIPAAVVTAWVIAMLPKQSLTIVFGVVVLVAVLMSVSGLRFPPRREVMFSAGVLSGVMGTFAAIGGPPVALIYQDSSGPRLRATMAGYFIVGASFSALTLIPAGKFGGQELLLTVLLIPGTLLGFLASRRLAPLLDRGYTRTAVLAVAAVSALLVIVQQIW
ncbi:MAG TPA: TSUP family transporter [Anaerolineaceae bacterium]